MQHCHIFHAVPRSEIQWGGDSTHFFLELRQTISRTGFPPISTTQEITNCGMSWNKTPPPFWFAIPENKPNPLFTAFPGRDISTWRRRPIGCPLLIGHFPQAIQLVALLRKMTCNLRHPMGVHHPVLAGGLENCFSDWKLKKYHVWQFQFENDAPPTSTRSRNSNSTVQIYWQMRPKS